MLVGDAARRVEDVLGEGRALARQKCEDVADSVARRDRDIERRPAFVREAEASLQPEQHLDADRGHTGSVSADEVLEAELRQRFRERLAGVRVPAHVCVVVGQHLVPVGQDADAGGRAVDRDRAVARGRPLELAREAVAQVEDAELVDDPAADGHSFVEREIPAGHRVQRLDREVGAGADEPADAEAVVELVPAVELGVGARDLFRREPVLRRLEPEPVVLDTAERRLDGARIAGAGVEELGPATTVVVAARRVSFHRVDADGQRLTAERLGGALHAPG